MCRYVQLCESSVCYNYNLAKIISQRKHLNNVTCFFLFCFFFVCFCCCLFVFVLFLFCFCCFINFFNSNRCVEWLLWHWNPFTVHVEFFFFFFLELLSAGCWLKKLPLLEGTTTARGKLRYVRNSIFFY